MSYDLFNHSTAICRKFSRQTWAKALELALLYGWKPKGTTPPSTINFYEINAEWDGNYFTNHGQKVKREDAFLLAAALEKSLNDIPDENPKTDWTSQFRTDDALPEWLSPEEKEMMEEELVDGLLDILGTHPVDYFAGEEKHHLIKMIRFCRLGSFEIL